jgi:hypothetical protein
MISASATIEHRISGQIGQPAAWMIEINGVLVVRRRRAAPGGAGLAGAIMTVGRGATGRN